MGFSRQEYWSELPFPSPGDLPNSEIQLGSPALQADSLPSEPPGKPPKILAIIIYWAHTTIWSHWYVESKEIQLLETKNRLVVAREGWGVWEIWLKMVKRYKFPVINGKVMEWNVQHSNCNWQYCSVYLCLVAQSCPTLCDFMDCSLPARLLCPWEFSRKEYWSGLPCPIPGDLHNPGIKPIWGTREAQCILESYWRSGY